VNLNGSYHAYGFTVLVLHITRDANGTVRIVAVAACPFLPSGLLQSSASMGSYPDGTERSVGGAQRCHHMSSPVLLSVVCYTS